MLKPISDRLDYGKLLAPPEGFKMESAVGTTYSLDLDALVGVCMAMGLSSDPDSAALNNPIYLLEMLRRTGDRVTLFCQSGQIKVPKSLNRLYILLEKMVYQIQPQRSINVAMPSFHPKVWVVKYQNKVGEKRYRMLVLSRNLTFDRSWDVAVCLEGTLVEGPVEKSLPIADLLEYLRLSIRGVGPNVANRRKKIEEMIKEIQQVEFKTDNRQLHDFEFIPVGVPQKDGMIYSMNKTPLLSSTFRELLIISPFLSASMIEDFNNRKLHDAQRLLLTRRESLVRLKPEHCDKFKIFTMKDMVVEGESAISEGTVSVEEDQVIGRQDIHAKIYFWNKDSSSELYLGSLNASHSALNGNIECVLRLMSKARYLRLTNLTQELFGGDEGGKENPFELTSLSDGILMEDDIQHKLEMRIKQLCLRSPKASVDAIGQNYRLTITFKGLKDNEEGLTIGPLLSSQNLDIKSKVIFDQMALLQLSEFYRIIAREGEHTVQRLIKISTANIPDTREEAVIQAVIHDTQTFYQYIAFLLADDYLISALEYGDLQKSLFKKSTVVSMPALYERMLQAASSTPEKFGEIDYILKMVKKDGVIPEGFTELYDAFRKAVGIR